MNERHEVMAMWIPRIPHFPPSALLCSWIQHR